MKIINKTLGNNIPYGGIFRLRKNKTTLTFSSFQKSVKVVGFLLSKYMRQLKKLLLWVRKLDDRGICQIGWHKKTAITKVFAAFTGMVEKNNKKNI